MEAKLDMTWKQGRCEDSGYLRNGSGFLYVYRGECRGHDFPLWLYFENRNLDQLRSGGCIEICRDPKP